jgi:hypothetical protein
MNHSTRVTRWPRRARPRPARTAAAITATLGLALLVSACGGSPGSHVAQHGSTTRAASSGASNAGGSTNSQSPSFQLLAFSRCMRSHGVPNWPDPAPTSHQDQRPFFHVPDSIDPNAPQITTKIHICQHLLHASNPLVTTQ